MTDKACNPEEAHAAKVEFTQIVRRCSSGACVIPVICIALTPFHRPSPKSFVGVNRGISLRRPSDIQSSAHETLK
jgi:hypothetical protein